MGLSELVNYTIQADGSGILKTLGMTKTAMANTGLAATQAQESVGRSHAAVAARLDSVGSKMMGFGKSMSAMVTLPALAAFAALGAAGAAAAKAHEILALNLRQSAHATEEQVTASEDYLRTLALTTGHAKGETRPALSALAAATHDVSSAQDLLAVALDISTAKGKPLEQVTTALARGYNGSTVGLSRMGVATKDASGRAKSFAEILGELKEQTHGAAEMAGRTTAMQWEIMKIKFNMLKADIATKLMPAFTGLTEKISGVMEWFLKMPDGAQQASLAIIGLLAVIGPLSTLLGGVAKIAGGTISVFGKLAQGAKQLGGAAGLLRIGWASMVAAGPWVIAAAGVAAAATLIYKSWETVNKSWDELKDRATTFTQRLNLQRQAVTELNHAATEASRGGLAAIQANWESDAADKASREMFAANMHYLESVRAVKAETGLTRKEVEALAKANGVDLANGGEEARKKLANLATGAGLVKAPLADLGATAHNTAKDFDDLKEQMDDLLGPFLSAEQAAVSYAKGQISLAKATAELLADGKLSNEEFIEARGLLAGLVSDWQNNYQAMSKNHAGVGELIAQKAGLNKQLADLAARFPGLKTEIDGYSARLLAVPTTVESNVVVQAHGINEALAGFAKLASVAAVFASESFIANMTSAYNAAHKHAVGGSVAAGSWAIVGEQGPELVRFPSAGTVHDAQSSAAMRSAGPRSGAGGGGTSITVPVTVMGSLVTMDDVAASVETAVAKRLRLQGSLAFLARS